MRAIFISAIGLLVCSAAAAQSTEIQAGIGVSRGFSSRNPNWTVGIEHRRPLKSLGIVARGEVLDAAKTFESRPRIHLHGELVARITLEKGWFAGGGLKAVREWHESYNKGGVAALMEMGWSRRDLEVFATLQPPDSTPNHGYGATLTAKAAITQRWLINYQAGLTRFDTRAFGSRTGLHVRIGIGWRFR